MRLSETGIKNLAEALAKFQEEVRNPANTATNPQFRSKYAPLDVVINTAKPILAKYGLSFVQSTGAEDELITVTTLLIHESGEWIESDPLVLPAYQTKSGGVKEFNAQGAGSALTYARRYSLSAMLGLSSEDDDDANGQVFGGNSESASTPKARGASATTSAPSAREKAVQAAKEKAAAKAAEESKNKEAEDKTEIIPEDEGAEPINKGQINAINNMKKLLAKKKASDPNFNVEELVGGIIAKLGKSSLEDLTFEQGKQVVLELNTEMRS